MKNNIKSYILTELERMQLKKNGNKGKVGKQTTDNCIGNQLKDTVKDDRPDHKRL